MTNQNNSTDAEKEMTGKGSKRTGQTEKGTYVEISYKVIILYIVIITLALSMVTYIILTQHEYRLNVYCASKCDTFGLNISFAEENACICESEKGNVRLLIP